MTEIWNYNQSKDNLDEFSDISGFTNVFLVNRGFIYPYILIVLNTDVNTNISQHKNAEDTSQPLFIRHMKESFQERTYSLAASLSPGVGLKEFFKLPPHLKKKVLQTPSKLVDELKDVNLDFIGIPDINMGTSVTDDQNRDSKRRASIPIKDLFSTFVNIHAYIIFILLFINIYNFR